AAWPCAVRAQQPAMPTIGFLSSRSPGESAGVVELMPTVGVIGYLLNPSDQMSEIESKGALTAAHSLGIELRVLNAKSENELDIAFAAVAKLDNRALVVSGEPFFDSQRERIVALSARHSVAAVYAWREYVLAGGLISYGTDLPGSYRQAA